MLIAHSPCGVSLASHAVRILRWPQL